MDLNAILFFTYHHQNRHGHGSCKQNLSHIIQLQVNQAHFSGGRGIVHGSPAFGTRVDDDSNGRAGGHHSVGPHGVLNTQGLLSRTGEFSNKTIENGNEKMENYHVRGHCHQFSFKSLVAIWQDF